MFKIQAWSHTSYNDQTYNLGGSAGAWFADIALHFLGIAAYLLPLGLAYLSWCVWQGSHIDDWSGELVIYRVLGVAVSLGAGSGLATLMLTGNFDFGSGGGIAGDMISSYLVQSFSPVFSGLFLLILFVTGLSLATGVYWLDALDAFWTGDMVITGTVIYVH